MDISEAHRRAIKALNDGRSTYEAIDEAIEACALRAEYGDCATGLGCDGGYVADSIFGSAPRTCRLRYVVRRSGTAPVEAGAGEGLPRKFRWKEIARCQIPTSRQR